MQNPIYWFKPARIVVTDPDGEQAIIITSSSPAQRFRWKWERRLTRLWARVLGVFA